MIKFSEIDTLVRAEPGVYEIHTLAGVALKVGIARDLRSRLRGHRASRQSGLRGLSADPLAVPSPEHVTSKSSILAKHLFFDLAIAPGYDLRTEAGRRSFLAEKCRVYVEYCVTREAARAIERDREASGPYRYVGRVQVRDAR